MKYTRQEVVRMLRKAGFHEAADEATRDLPGDPAASGPANPQPARTPGGVWQASGRW